MPRLIDVDVLRERMYHDAFETDSDMQKWDSGCWIRYKMFENALEETPTVDAEPVRYGRWEKALNIGEMIWCSECGWMKSKDERNYRYCPNCGAKMDERREDADE